MILELPGQIILPYNVQSLGVILDLPTPKVDVIKKFIYLVVGKYQKTCNNLMKVVRDRNLVSVTGISRKYGYWYRSHPSKPTCRQRLKAVGGASKRSERGRSALFKNPLFF